jgi:hypothetical protein
LTPPIAADRGFPFDVAVLVVEVFSWLWLAEASSAGWPTQDVKSVREIYNRFDSGRAEVKGHVRYLGKGYDTDFDDRKFSK